MHDEVTGNSFQIDKTITIDDDNDASTGALPLPGSNEDNNNSLQQLIPQEQLEQ